MPLEETNGVAGYKQLTTQWDSIADEKESKLNKIPWSSAEEGIKTFAYWAKDLII